MNETLQILIILASVIAGALCIVFSNQLMRKYPASYMNSYFYYLLFLYIFGVYSILGSGAAGYYFDMYEGPEHFSTAIEMFLLILGVPFLILFNYMFIRISFEISNLTLSGRFSLIYFILSLFLMAIYTYTSFQISGNHPEYYDLFRFWQKVAFSIFLLLVHISGFILILVKTKSLLDRNERQAIRIYGSWFALFALLSVSLLFVSAYAGFLKYVFIFFFLSINLLPILFHSFYLNKHYVAISAGNETVSDLTKFTLKYEISKRETDIIELICRGQTNQEISDSLFISLQTVKDHIHRIYLKTGIKNRVQLINLIRVES